MPCKPTTASCELNEYYGANGEIETSFGQGRWNAGLRFFGGFNVNDLYLKPELSYVGWEPYELYVAVTIISMARPAPWGASIRTTR